MEIRNQNSSFLLKLTAKLFTMNSFFFLHRILIIFLQQEIIMCGQLSVTSDTLSRQMEIRCTAGNTVR